MIIIACYLIGFVLSFFLFAYLDEWASNPRNFLHPPISPARIGGIALLWPIMIPLLIFIIGFEFLTNGMYSLYKKVKK